MYKKKTKHKEILFIGNGICVAFNLIESNDKQHRDNMNFLRIGVPVMLILIMLQTQNTYINYTVVENQMIHQTNSQTNMYFFFLFTLDMTKKKSLCTI